MATYRLKVDTAQQGTPNNRCWQAEGCDYLFPHTESACGQALLDRMQETASCRYLRCHSPLSVRVRQGVETGCKVYSEDGEGNPSYDFSRINRLYGEWVARGIKPVVEIDYFPVELSVKLDADAAPRDEGDPAADCGPKSWTKWKALVRAFVRNLIDTFGLDEVRTWYFEVWNEPDHWPIEDLPTFLKMYDVFVDAVTAVDDQLRVGGPACYGRGFLERFLDHVVNGTNTVTGKRGTRFDFLSFHIYGLSGGWLKKGPVIQPQVQRFTQVVLWIDRLLRHYKMPDGVEFHLNEWGLCSNFFRTVNEHPQLAYRNSEESALFLTKLVDCLWHIQDAYGFETSMLLYWGFAIEAAQAEPFLGQRTLTTAGNIPKPIATGYEMLARLGESRLTVENHIPGARCGILATRHSDDRLAILIYNYEETDDNLDVRDTVTICLSNIAGSQLEGTSTPLDRKNNNTYRTWQALGCPARLTEGAIVALQEASKLTATKTLRFPVIDGRAVVDVDLQRHSMLLLELS